MQARLWELRGGWEREMSWMRKRTYGNGESSGAVKTMIGAPDGRSRCEIVFDQGPDMFCLHVSAANQPSQKTFVCTLNEDDVSVLSHY